MQIFAFSYNTDALGNAATALPIKLPTHTPAKVEGPRSLPPTPAALLWDRMAFTAPSIGLDQS